MDTQAPTPPQPVNPQPIPSASTIQSSPVVTNNNGSKNKMIMIVVSLAIVLVALIAGGAYYYMNMQQSTTPPPAPIVTQPTEIATPAPSLTPEEQLNQVSVDDGETDFSAVDKDLQSL